MIKTHSPLRPCTFDTMIKKTSVKQLSLLLKGCWIVFQDEKHPAANVITNSLISFKHKLLPGSVEEAFNIF